MILDDELFAIVCRKPQASQPRQAGSYVSSVI